MQHFKYYNREDLLSLVRLRKFETKLGERLQTGGSKEGMESALADSGARYVLFGIPEDIGIRANDGIPGADTAWIPFLHSFLNMQSNDFLLGDEILILGHFDFGDMQFVIDRNAPSEEEKREAYRHAVTSIDDEVETLVKKIVEHGKIPIAIGGGHNNAYPLIKGAAKGMNQLGKIPLAQINCINLDAHTDYRPAEGRHSGNACRYAEEDGYLLKYCVIGVQESYIPQNVWIDMVNNPFIDCISYEDIYLLEKRNFRQAVHHAIGFTADNFTGIELDLDALQSVLSSAATPAGVPAIDARQYLIAAAQDCQPAYLHICEGACQLADGRRDDSTGKLLSLLVSDFVRAAK